MPVFVHPAAVGIFRALKHKTHRPYSRNDGAIYSLGLHGCTHQIHDHYF